MTEDNLEEIEVERKILLMLNGLLHENPLLKQEGNNYTLLVKVLIDKYKDKIL